MVALPGLDSYSKSDTDRARQQSPGLDYYLNLLDQAGLPEIYRIRHKAWCECAVATLLETAPPAWVVSFWSEVAENILARVWRESELEQEAIALFALGKLGAHELNLSSDVDLLVVVDPKSAFQCEKRVRLFNAKLQNRSEYGFLLRLDYDLRPGGQFGPLLTTPSQFEDHYWSQGEAWERLAMVRFRPLLGASDLQNNIMELVQRFTYRKFLDFTLLEDLKALRSRIHSQGHTREDSRINIKLEVGGIRDIELFTHALLVIHGGKIPRLRTCSTEKAIQGLIESGILPKDEGMLLIQKYWHYRQIENQAQARSDNQTHFTSDSEDLQTELRAVDKTVSSLLGQVDLMEIHLPVDGNAQLQWLTELGFSERAIHSIWPDLMKATALSHKTDRDERARLEFLFQFINALAKQPVTGRERGLAILLDFVRSTRAKATFFSMLLRSPSLIDHLAKLFCQSHYLGSILASRPELLDHFLLQLDEPWSPDLATALDQMAARKLITEIWAAARFMDDLQLGPLNSHISETADAISIQLLKILKSEFSKSKLELLALGKWGGGELGLRSDLDFVFVTPETPNEDDQKVARRFISRLTDPARGGQLYNIDLRLRPTGQSGALMIQDARLNEYWQTEAKPWERQAYLRSRIFNSNISINRDLLFSRQLTTEDHVELQSIRQKLLKPMKETELNAKYNPGGLLDIEFTAQVAHLSNGSLTKATSTIDMIHELSSSQVKWGHHSKALLDHYEFFRRTEQIQMLVSLHSHQGTRKDSDEQVQVAQLLKMKSDPFWNEFSKRLTEANRIVRDLESD